MAIIPFSNFNQRIPNDPFYYPETNSLSSAAGPLIVGGGISINYSTSVISVTGGGGGGTVTGVTGTSPIVITGTAAAPNVTILPASTTQAGAVQLYDGTNNVSDTLALTANMGRFLQEQIDALLVSSNLTFAGTYAGTVSNVTAAGAAVGFSNGANLPAPDLTNQDFFVIVTADGIYTPPGMAPTAASKGDWFLSDGVSWKLLDVGPSINAATTTTQGIVELATVAETDAKLDGTRAVTPASLINYLSCTVPRGYLITGTAAGGACLPWGGVAGQVLTVDTTSATGLAWCTTSNLAIPCACILAKGDLIVGSAAATPTALPVGTLGQVLTVVGTNPTSCLAWCSPGAGISFTAKGQVAIGTGVGSCALCAAGGCGQILVSDSFCTAGAKWCCAYPSIGSLAIGCSSLGGVYSLPVGLNGTVLTSCSTCTGGAFWGPAGGGAPATSTVQGTVYGYMDLQSVGLGVQALQANCVAGTFPSATVAVGAYSLRSNTTGSNNTAVGTYSLCTNTTGIYNVAVGTSSLLSNSTGSLNTAVGVFALRLNTAGNNNAFGYAALCSTTTGSNNVGLGSYALRSNSTGTLNTAVGNLAACANTTGSRNAAVGYYSMTANTTGSSNTALGYYAMHALTTGCGNVQIGGVTPIGSLQPPFTITTQDNRVVVGSIQTTNAYIQVAWTVTSDARDKLVEGPVPHGLEFVEKLEPKAFHFRETRESDVPNGPKRYGFLAQDILELEGDDAVIIDTEDKEKLKYNGEALVPVLVNAVKELSAKLKAVQERLDTLEGN